MEEQWPSEEFGHKRFPLLPCARSDEDSRAEGQGQRDIVPSKAIADAVARAKLGPRAA